MPGRPAPRPSARKAAVALALAFFAASPAKGQGWTGSNTSAGFTSGGAMRGIVLTCAGSGALELAFENPGSGLPEGARRTVAVTVDGTAFLVNAAARRDPATGAQVLVHAAPYGDLAPLIGALKTGGSVEIAVPAGRYEVPLNGSGAALAALEEGCAG